MLLDHEVFAIDLTEEEGETLRRGKSLVRLHDMDVGAVDCFIFRVGIGEGQFGAELGSRHKFAGEIKRAGSPACTSMPMGVLGMERFAGDIE